MRSCWALNTTAGTARLSRTRCTEARTDGLARGRLGAALVAAVARARSNRYSRSTSLSCNARAIACSTLSDAPRRLPRSRRV